MTKKADPELRKEVGKLMRTLKTSLTDVSHSFATVHSMNPTDARAIVAILDAQRAGEEIGPTALANTLGISTASATSLVDRMEEAGHMHRVPVAGDRRRVTLDVGDHAKKEGAAYFGALQRRIAKSTADMSDSDLEVVQRYLHAVIDAVEQHRTDPRMQHPLVN